MSLEDRSTDRKSLKVVLGRNAQWSELAKDCVCFANGGGGRLLIGIEDGEEHPPADQAIPRDLPERVQTRVSELTVNVQVLPQIQRAQNGGEVLVVAIQRATGVASTTDGRYYIRIADRCCPVVGDDVLRLADERPAWAWEAMDSRVPRDDCNAAKEAAFVAAMRTSDRFKASVKEKSADELLAHYGLTEGNHLTNLGVLLLGDAAHRRRLGTAPLVQAVKYDELRIPTNVTTDSGDRDRLGNRGVAGVAILAKAVTISQIGEPDEAGRRRAKEWCSLFL